MRNIKLGMGFTVFVIFFGIAMLEAFRDKNWWGAGFWVLMGGAFILADNLKRKGEF